MMTDPKKSKNEIATRLNVTRRALGHDPGSNPVSALRAFNRNSLGVSDRESFSPIYKPSFCGQRSR
jgi:hypothetical protein